MPEAAKANTPAGAEAFVRYFMDQVTKAWTEPNAEVLPPLCLDSSKACATWQSAAESLVRLNQHFSGVPLTIKSVTASGKSDSGSTIVNLQGIQLDASVLDSTGKVVESVKGEPVAFDFHLSWTSGSWQVEKAFEGVVS